MSTVRIDLDRWTEIPMGPRKKAVVELALAGVSAVLVVITVVWPTWWESLTGGSPDGGDGSAERLLAVGWLLATLLLVASSRRHLRAQGGLPHES